MLKSRLSGAFDELRKQYKGTNPYRQEPIPRQERLAQYTKFTPEIEQMMRQSVGDAAVDRYIVKMEAEARKRYGQGGMING
jgi:hypothetical protein